MFLSGPHEVPLPPAASATPAATPALAHDRALAATILSLQSLRLKLTKSLAVRP